MVRFPVLCNKHLPNLSLLPIRLSSIVPPPLFICEIMKKSFLVYHQNSKTWNYEIIKINSKRNENTLNVINREFQFSIAKRMEKLKDKKYNIVKNWRINQWISSKWKWNENERGNRKEKGRKENSVANDFETSRKNTLPLSPLSSPGSAMKERERERGRGRGRRGEREKERWFGEAGMAQIVVYNRTGIETRFVAFQLAYALVRGEEREKGEKAKFWHIWSYDTSLKWRPLLREMSRSKHVTRSRVSF